VLLDASIERKRPVKSLRTKGVRKTKRAAFILFAVWAAKFYIDYQSDCFRVPDQWFDSVEGKAVWILRVY
jgi:hypothetical protein